MHTILLIDIILYCILDSKAMKKKIHEFTQKKIEEEYCVV